MPVSGADVARRAGRRRWRRSASTSARPAPRRGVRRIGRLSAAGRWRRRGPAAMVDACDLVGDGARRRRPTATRRTRDVEVVAVGIPGRVDVADGTVRNALNLGIDAPTPFGTDLASRIGCAVHVENDVNAGALGAAALLGVDTSVEPRLPQHRHRARRRPGARRPDPPRVDRHGRRGRSRPAARRWPAVLVRPASAAPRRSARAARSPSDGARRRGGPVGRRRCG